MYRITTYLFISLFFAGSVARSQSQDALIDSLSREIKNAKHDTVKLNILFVLAENIYDDNLWPKYNEEAYKLARKLAQSNIKLISKKGKAGLALALNNFGYIQNNIGEASKAMGYYDQSLKLFEELNDKKGIAYMYNNIGAIHDSRGNTPLALEYWRKSLAIREEIKDKNGIAESLNNIGFIYNKQGNIPEALAFYERSLKIAEQLKDEDSRALTLSNIGTIYEVQGDLAAALDHYQKSLKIREKIGDRHGLCTSLNNIGALYSKQNKTHLALEFYNKSLKLCEELGERDGMANAFNNIGGIFFSGGDKEKSLFYYTKGLKLYKEINDLRGESNTYQNMAAVYIWFASPKRGGLNKQKDMQLASAYSDSSLFLSEKLGFPEHRRNSEIIAVKIDSALSDFKGALDHFKKYIIYRDSINNKETRRASMKNQLKYEYDKKEAVIKEQQEKERAVAGEKNHRQQIAIWSVAAGLILVIGFAFFVFRSLKVTREQKRLIEEKQREVLDSIHYAKRIQQSLLPNEKYIDKALKRLLKN